MAGHIVVARVTHLRASELFFWSFFFVVTVHCFQCTPICGIVINKGGKRAAIHRSLMQIIKSMNDPMQMRKTPHISAAGTLKRCELEVGR
ncbi:hypothetical protein M431DRAFT_420214 [Trichoderma harzianum CBS 226.95]|uniref:Uncharacterized protein n=1 Tax=Trichoderma harzianum CBS 226.95 TaxID=983964 RepID=A0A2T4AGI4_TRIHA|nr:hypothetical protein M431DRAFT_420214 [Trichoderma harzianum CBS 226.95]PTB56194.1 hypothetical protein M431DRAFT_420214 [Trichoderma harzianum CBS 226.95]